MRIKVEYPGYWAHGRIFNATRGPVDLADGSQIDCWHFTDSECGEIAIPAVHGREIVADAA